MHGLGEGEADWDGVAPAFARHYRVYAPDLRGHGRSDRPGDYSVELMEADVLGFLDALQLDRVDLIGHSMGGLVGYLRPGIIRGGGAAILEDVAALDRATRARSGRRGSSRSTGRWCWPSAGRSTAPTPEAWIGPVGSPQEPGHRGGAGSHVPQDWVAELARRIRAPDRDHRGRALIHVTEPEAFTRAALTFLGPA